MLVILSGKIINKPNLNYLLFKEQGGVRCHKKNGLFIINEYSFVIVAISLLN